MPEITPPAHAEHPGESLIKNEDGSWTQTNIDYTCSPLTLNRHARFSVHQPTEERAVNEIRERLLHLGEDLRFYAIYRHTYVRQWVPGGESTMLSSVYEELLPSPLEG